jgi:serine phosphatase RsbU (regulator of sigma subunit)
MLTTELTYLLLLIASTVVLNVAISFWFWLRYRTQLYSCLLRVWIAQFSSLMVHGALQGHEAVNAVLQGFACMIGSWGVSELLHRFIDAKFDIKPYFLALFPAALLTGVFHWLGAPFWLFTSPPVLVYCVPIAYSLYKVFRSPKFKTFTPAKNGFVGVSVFLTIHLADYPFLADKPEATLFGFVSSILIVFCIAIFGPMVVVEIASAETSQLKREQELLKKDLEVTLAVQAFLLPKKPDIRTPSINLVSHFKPAVQAGGDWWWHDETPDGRVHIIVGDVTGHGPDSAMVTALVASSYQTLMNLRPQATAAEILQALNSSMLSACEERYFMTMTVIDFDPKTSRYLWAAAAAPPFFHLGKDGKTKTISCEGNPLGSSEFMFKEGAGDLAAGERLMLFTDGITDFETDDGRKFGMRSWAQLIEETRGLPLKESRDRIVERIASLSVKSDWPDDMTFVVVEPGTPSSH